MMKKNHTILLAGSIILILQYSYLNCNITIEKLPEPEKIQKNSLPEHLKFKLAPHTDYLSIDSLTCSSCHFEKNDIKLYFYRT